MVIRTLLTVTIFSLTTSAFATEQKKELVATQEQTQAKVPVSESVEEIQRDKEFCMQTLQDEKADINGLSPSGKTPLQLLVLYYINNFETQQLIAHALKRGANANIRDEQGRTPLFFITAYAVCPEIFSENQRALDTSLTTEAPQKQREKQAPTKKAAHGKEKAKPDAAPAQPKRNPLHSRELTMAVTELLLAYSADPTVTDRDNVSPVLLAVSQGDQEMLQLFARYGLLEKIFHEQEATEPSVQEEVIVA